MIRVCYDGEGLRMRITGHAGSAPYGHDLVCAAASILALTLEEALRRLGALGAGSVKRAGFAEIRGSAEEKGVERVRTVYETIFTGYERLREQYPEYVETERTGEREKI